MHYMLLDGPSKLEAERLLLRPYKLGDGEWLNLIFQENESHLATVPLARELTGACV